MHPDNVKYGAIHDTLQPSHLPLGMDLIFQQPVKVEWKLLKCQSCLQVNAKNEEENKTQIHHD
jgi:hypothetical protein